MRLLHAPSYSIRVIKESTSDSEPMCEVLIAGTATGKVLEGAVFEAALQWNEYILLFITNDVPFEDTLNIYLLDWDLSVVDYARMYFIYSTGIFSNLDLTEEDAVHFNFLGETAWTIKLYHKKKFAIPIVSSPLGVHRPFRFFRRFRLSTHPLARQSKSQSRTARLRSTLK